MLLGAFWDDI